jgi:hypothetical protein
METLKNPLRSRQSLFIGMREFHDTRALLTRFYPAADSSYPQLIAR